MKVKIDQDILDSLKKRYKSPTEAFLEGYINEILRSYFKKEKEL